MTIRSDSAPETIRKMYEAAVSGDQDEFFSYIAEDFVLEEPPYLPYGRTYCGAQGFAELFVAATAVIDLSTLQVEYVFGDDERACASITCAVTGTDIRPSILEEWIVNDGRVRWGRVFWFDPRILPTASLSPTHPRG